MGRLSNGRDWNRYAIWPPPATSRWCSSIVPDRLSRKYAYQVLLTEEFGRHGVETRFLNGPSNATAEDQLLVQFQGMIAEYERAQILERSRRGKRHRARAGEISVLGGAPYGYRYIRKRDDNPAAYVVIEAEARVVRDVYEHYTGSGWSIAAITRWLNEQGVPTRKVGTRWERSTVWAMLRNPAYRGTACFGKTRRARRQRVTRPLRLRGGAASRDSANHERPREEWIEIPVPVIVDESTFARAQELLHENKVHARRRTIEPSLVQGLVSCQKCGYALSARIGPVERPENSLLPVYRVGRMAAPRRSPVRHAPRAAGPAGRRRPGPR